MSAPSRAHTAAALVSAEADVLALSPGRQLPPHILSRITAAVASAPDSWADLVRFDPTSRYSTRLYRCDLFEIWLICWDFGQDTLLHDHGGSVGAFTVASGTLQEDFGSTTSAILRSRRWHTGDIASFGRTYVHNLVNASLERVVSIHAYSKPLTTMNFYCWLPSGMRHLRTVRCELGEPDTSELERTASALRKP